MAANPRLLAPCGESPASPLATSAVSAHSVSSESPLSGAFSVSSRALAEMTFLPHSLAPGGGAAPLASLAQKKNEEGLQPTENIALSVHAADMLRKELFSVRVAGRYKADLVGACLFMRHGARTPKENFSISATGTESGRFPPGDRGRSPLEADRNRADAGDNSGAKPQKPGGAGVPVVAAAEPQARVPETGKSGENTSQNGLVQHPTGTPKRPRELRNEAGRKPESCGISQVSDTGSFKETPDTKSVPRQGEGTSSGLPYGVEECQEAANGAKEHIPKGGSVDSLVAHASQAHACRREAGEQWAALSTARPSDSRGPTVWRPPSIAGSGCGAFSLNSFVEAGGGNRVTSSVVTGAQRGLLGHVPREHSPARSSPPGAETDVDAPAGLTPEMLCCPEETEEKKGAGAAYSIAAQFETSKERATWASSRAIKDHSLNANNAPSGCWFGVLPMGPCGGHPSNRAQHVRTSLSFLTSPPTPLSPQSPDPTSTASSSSSTPISSRSRSCSSGAEAELAVVAGASPQTWRAVSPKAARGPEGRPAFTPTYGFETALSSDAVLPAASKAGTPMPALPCKEPASVATLPLASTLPCRAAALLQTPGVAEVSPARSDLLTSGRSLSASQGAACPFNCAPGLLTAAGWQQAACIGCALRRKQRTILRNAFLRERLKRLEGSEEACEGGGHSQPLQNQGVPSRGSHSACRDGGTRGMGKPVERGESPMQENSACAETNKDQTLLQRTDASESYGVSVSSRLSPRSRASGALVSSLTAPGCAASCPQSRSSLPQSCDRSHDSSTSTHVDPCAAAGLHVSASACSPSVSSPSVSSRAGNSSCSPAGSISGAGCTGALPAGCGHPHAFSTSPQGVRSSTAAPELPTNSSFQGFILDRSASLFLCSTESLRCQQTAEGVLAGLLRGPGALREIRRPGGSLEAAGDRPSSPQRGTVCKPFDCCTEQQASPRLFAVPRSAPETRRGDRVKAEVNDKAGDLGGERQPAEREEMKAGGRDPHEKEENAAEPRRGGSPGSFGARGRTRGVCLHVAPSGSPLASALKAKSQIVKFLKQRCLAESVCYQRACLQLRAESDLLRQLTGWEEKAGLKVMKKFVSSYSTYLFHGVPPPPLSNGVIQFRPATADAPTTASFATFCGDLSHQSSALFSPFEETHAVSVSPPLSRQRSSSLSQAARPLAPEAARSAELEGRETDQRGLEGSEERRNGDGACGGSSEQGGSAPGVSLERRAEASRQLATQEVDAEKGQKEEAPDASVSLLQAIFLGADVITRLQFGEEEEVGWRAGGTSLLELASRLERMADWCLEREQSCHATQQTPGRKPARASRSTPFLSADKTHREKEWRDPECETRRQSGGEHEQETEAAKGAAGEFGDRSEQGSGTEPPLLQIFVTHQSALLALQGALSVPTEELHVPPFGCYISAELLRLYRSSAGDDWDYPFVGEEAKGTADEERREERRTERVGRKASKQGGRSHSPWFSNLEFDKPRENKAGYGDSPLSPLHALSRSEEELSSCTSTPRTAPTDESSSLSCSVASVGASAVTDSVESYGTSFEGDKGYPPSNQSAREVAGLQLSSSVSSYTADNAASVTSLPVPDVPVSPSSHATQPSSRPPVSHHPFLEKLTSRKPREARKKHPGYLIRWTINGSQPVVLPPSLRFKPPSQPPFSVSGSPSASASASSSVASLSLSLASLSSRGEGQEERDKATLAGKLEQALQERGERLYALQHCAATSEYLAADALVRSVLAEEASFLPRFPLLKDAETRIGTLAEEQAGGLEMHGCVPPQEAKGESGPGGVCGAVSSAQAALVDPEEITQFLCCRRMPCFCFHCLQRAARRLWSQRQRTGQDSETGRLTEAEPGKTEGGTGRGQEGKPTNGEERLCEENELDFETCNIVELDRLLSFLDERIAKYGMPIPVGDDSRRHPELALQTQARGGKGDAGAKKRDAELEAVRQNV